MPGDSQRFDLYDGQREFSISAKRRRFTMKEYQSLSHTRWDCKYHVVFIPKRRKKKLFGALRRHVGEMLHELAAHKESKIVEGHLRAGPGNSDSRIGGSLAPAMAA
ncbi:Transposase, fragment [Aromatoleum aromaticum EbN1]|uniref:Transposase n=1 Tax=Aromatoleum aromaticum (strain DSM 19018 / LMG 30748 / EbN1) TaxID=76114 RepID=Q5NY60_AROAE|nr:Transposase, fragment [Aromatoleum aromaticum EbN1]